MRGVNRGGDAEVKNQIGDGKHNNNCDTRKIPGILSNSESPKDVGFNRSGVDQSSTREITLHDGPPRIWMEKGGSSYAPVAWKGLMLLYDKGHPINMGTLGFHITEINNLISHCQKYIDSNSLN